MPFIRLVHKLVVWMELSVPDPCDDMATDVYTEQVDQLYRSSRISPAANVLLAGLTGIAFYSLGEISCIGWLSVLVVLNLCRYLHLRRRNYSVNRSNPGRSCLEFVIGSTATGLVWGVLPIIASSQSSVALQIFEAFVLCGISTAGIVVLSGIRAAITLFLLTTILPYTTCALLSNETITIVVGMMCVVYLTFMLRASFEFHSNLKASLTLSNERETLSKSLIEKNENIESVNHDLEAALCQAQKASELKSNFLANMSHELRTPLNGILSMTELALEKSNNAEITKHLRISRESAEMLLHLINDILDLSKIEAGKIQLDNIPFNVRTEVEKVVALVKASLRDRALTLLFDIDENVPEYLESDPFRLQQIIMNLLNNAVKFTSEQGAVLLHLWCEKIDDGTIRLHLTVADTGIGISSNNQEKIFDAFTQADTSTSRVFGGTGLGLAITRQLVDLLEGSITLQSIPDLGTTFHINFPVKIATALTATNEPDGDLSGSWGLNILVAEDNRINQKVIETLLKQCEHRVTIVPNGVEALKAFQQSPFDIILMDCQMPLMDGYTASQAIRAHEQSRPCSNSQIPIIAVTAHAMPSDQERCMAAGMTGYVAKPIEKSKLYEAISDAVKKRRTGASTEG